jgi:hypothetical protein
MTRFLVGLSLACLAAIPAAHADAWIQGTVTEIQILAAGDANDKVVVLGTFNTGCAYNGFVIGASDPYFKETYAAMLAAKISATPIKFLNVYCLASGYARGNGYAVSP